MAKPRNQQPDVIFACGYKPRHGGVNNSKMPVDVYKTLPKAEQKLFRNFRAYLSGRGSRCPECLHKATKHEFRCGAKGCDCSLEDRDVYAIRERIKAPGWEDD